MSNKENNSGRLTILILVIIAGVALYYFWGSKYKEEAPIPHPPVIQDTKPAPIQPITPAAPTTPSTSAQ